MFNSPPTPGSIGPDGNCVSCGKHIRTTGGCFECQAITRSYVPLPSITITIAPTVVPVPEFAMCPHMRPDWRQCPHCLGIDVGEP